jgi:hypothetical protein
MRPRLLIGLIVIAALAAVGSSRAADPERFEPPYPDVRSSGSGCPEPSLDPNECLSRGEADESGRLSTEARVDSGFDGRLPEFARRYARADAWLEVQHELAEPATSVTYRASITLATRFEDEDEGLEGVADTYKDVALAAFSDGCGPWPGCQVSAHVPSDAGPGEYVLEAVLSNVNGGDVPAGPVTIRMIATDEVTIGRREPMIDAEVPLPLAICLPGGRPPPCITGIYPTVYGPYQAFAHAATELTVNWIEAIVGP